MRFPHLSLSLLLLGLCLLPAKAQTRESIDWDYEIRLLEKDLVKKHPNAYFYFDSLSFHRKMVEIIPKAYTQSIFSTAVMLQQAVALLGDAHTMVNYHYLVEKQLMIPMTSYWFEEGLYILETEERYQELLGKKLHAINQHPIQEVIDSMATLMVNENPSLLKNRLPDMLNWVQLLQHFGFADTCALQLQVTDETGRMESIAIDFPVVREKSVFLEIPETPIGWEDQRSFFWKRYLGDEKLYYIQYNRCWSRESEKLFGSGASALFMPSYREFEKELIKELKKKSIDKLVFDMRFNGGGNSLQGTRLIRKISKINFRGEGKIYVLIGRKTFSSAIINTIDFMRMTPAILVGEETGGRPNHFGEVRRFVLPESRLIVSHSTKYFREMEKEDPPSLKPKLQAPIFFREYLKGIDPALEVVRSL